MPTPLDALKAAIAGGKALLVCGAGVSRAVTGDAAKGWKGLIESAIDAAPKEPGSVAMTQGDNANAHLPARRRLLPLNGNGAPSPAVPSFAD
jgi:hypothetical protein